MKKLFLIGYMGCGKSSLGRKIAKASGMQFMDMDSIIEQREGASISDIFHYEGESYFRAAESALIEELGRSAGEQILRRIENPDEPVFEKVLTSAYRPYDTPGSWGEK